MTKSATSEPHPRRTITPAERALDALDVATRRVEMLFAKSQRLHEEQLEADAELDAARARLAYVQANPDLPKKPESAAEPDA